MRRPALLLVLVALAPFAGCGGSTGPTATEPPALSTRVLPAGGVRCAPLEYGGEGQPDVLVVAALPLTRPALPRALPLLDAMRAVLGRAGWRAGKLRVALQACDEAAPRVAVESPGRCAEDAAAYAANPTVLAVVGPLGSACAEAMLPVLAAAPGGGLPLVSPGAASTCLTAAAPGCGDPPEPRPDGLFARVGASTAVQAAGIAQAAADADVRRLLVLAEDEPGAAQLAASLVVAAPAAGVEVVAVERLADAGGFADVLADAPARQVDGVVLAGLDAGVAAAAVQAKLDVLGPAGDGVRLFLADALASQALLALVPTAAEGALVVAASATPLGPLGDLELGPASAAGAKAMATALAAIDRSAGRREGVRERLLAQVGGEGVAGAVRLSPTGEPLPGPLALLRVEAGRIVEAGAVEPAGAVLDAALG